MAKSTKPSNRKRAGAAAAKRKPPLLTRRDFLVAGATTCFLTPVESELTGLWGAGRNWIFDLWKRYTDPDYSTFVKMDDLDAEKLRLARDLFVDRGKVLKLAGGRAHHLYVNRIHPDDEWACKSIEEVAGQLSRRHLRDAGGFDFSSAESFVCTGSPVSNERTRVFMEYHYVDGNDPDAGLIRNEKPRLKLPFEYHLERDNLVKIGATRHESEGGYNNPNWSMRGRFNLVPGLGSESCDYLMVARLPNWLEGPRPRYRDFRNSVTVFGGCHGEGTAAIRLLFQNLELLKRLDRVAKANEYWQAIIKVTNIVRSTHPISGTQRLVASSLKNDLVAAERVTVSRG